MLHRCVVLVKVERLVLLLLDLVRARWMNSRLETIAVVDDVPRSRSSHPARAESTVASDGLLESEEHLYRQIFGVGRRGDKPASISQAQKCVFDAYHTLPSAQSFIWESGRFALYMAVVSHHIGSPKKSTMAQNDAMTRTLVRIPSGVSGGGSFLA